MTTPWVRGERTIDATTIAIRLMREINEFRFMDPPAQICMREGVMARSISRLTRSLALRAQRQPNHPSAFGGTTKKPARWSTRGIEPVSKLWVQATRIGPTLHRIGVYHGKKAKFQQNSVHQPFCGTCRNCAS